MHSGYQNRSRIHLVRRSGVKEHLSTSQPTDASQPMLAAQVTTDIRNQITIEGCIYSTF